MSCIRQRVCVYASQIMFQLLRFILDWVHGQCSSHIYLRCGWVLANHCEQLMEISELRQISRWTQKDIIPEKRLIQTIFNSCAIAQCSNMCWVYGRNHGMPEENYSIKWVEFLCVCVRVETYGKWDHPVIPSSIIQFTQFG